MNKGVGGVVCETFDPSQPFKKFDEPWSAFCK